MIKLNINIPDNYLNPEVIADFEVTGQMKEIWAVELDLMDQLDKICRKHNLTYFAGAGTLLGAVRHKGFIPWDDDMDFYMLREDYDKLMQLADEFQSPYFLQNGYTDTAITRTYARLRNSNTTACSSWESRFNCNKGIFIDIFPLDGISENYLADKTQKALNTLYRTSMRNKQPVHFKNQSFRVSCNQIFINTVVTLMHMNKIECMKKYETNLKKYSVPGTKMWGNRTLVYDCPRSRRPLEDWKDIITVPFEFMSIPIPKNYDEILKQQYGNYMQYPKNKSAGKMHEIIMLSTDMSYEQYIQQQ